MKEIVYTLIIPSDDNIFWDVMTSFADSLRHTLNCLFRRFQPEK